MAGLLVLVAALVGVLASYAWTLTRDSRRRERILAFAVQRGWRYESRDPALVDRWFGVPFGRGERREATAVLRGEVNGRAFVAFEYSFVRVDDTRSRDAFARAAATVGSRERYSIVAVDLPTYLPAVTVRPEGLKDRLGVASGVVADIELESEDFNRAFRVSAPNPRAASDLLTPRTMALLLSRPRFPFRVEGEQLVSWRPGVLDPMDVLRRASTLDAVIDGAPSFLWTDHGPREGPSVATPPRPA